MTSNEFRYHRDDFGPLPVALQHLDIVLNFINGVVRAASVMHLVARETLEELRLDARDIDVLSVACEIGGVSTPTAFDLRRSERALYVKLPRRMAAGEAFRLRTHSLCTPTDHILEGIYHDTTPAGAPQQYISQCQQWGFQRILPILDDCTAKCTMHTTIEADARYSHLISNGNICPPGDPAGKGVVRASNPTRQTISFDNPIPMAPYLFIAAVGTWEVVADTVTYPSGREVRLEYLVPPGRCEGARLPMAILKKSVLWQHATQGYEYPFDVYRTICMEKSNFGGMENVGNTTIITSAALVDDFITDARLIYAYGVIVHEFEHNQCGSDVTMRTPFDVWLNEAYTVDVERHFLASQFDADEMRLAEIDTVRAPVGGPLAIEDAGHLGKIVRDGFNDPDELIDGVTYVKAAEVIRMLRGLLGEAQFTAARQLYFERFSGGNADTDDFFGCFEEASGMDLAQFRKEWLYTIGYPIVTGSHRYDAPARRLTIRVSQRRSGEGGLFHFPLALAAVDQAGGEIAATAVVVPLRQAEQQVVFEDVPAPAFISYNRDASFYGTFVDASATPASLRGQLRRDASIVGRVEAMRTLTDLERMALLEGAVTTPSEAWLEAYGEMLADDTLSPSIKARMLTIDEASLERRYLPWYCERWEACRTLTLAAVQRWRAELTALFEATDTYRRDDTLEAGIGRRKLKGVLLHLLSVLDDEAAHALAEGHLSAAWHLTDRAHALACIVRSSHPRRLELMAGVREAWSGHLNGYAAYLGTLGQREDEEVFDLLAEEEAREGFLLSHPTHSRALLLPMLANSRMLWSEAGLEWLTDAVVRVADVSEYVAVSLLDALQQAPHLRGELKPLVARTLAHLGDIIDPVTHPSVAGRIALYGGREGRG